MAVVHGSTIRFEGYKAYVPAPLPPDLEWTTELVRALSEADGVMGMLAAEGAWLPNPHVLLRPFVRSEAVESSRIEGTQASLGELLAAEAGAAVERSPDDLREVGNYVAALEHGMARLRELPICVRLVREVHEKLMTGVRGHNAAPGEFRTIQNWIGRPGSTVSTATYVPPPPGEIAPCLAAWERFLHESRFPPLITIAMAHYQFEAIHPFLDGNGRVGRLLITLFLIEKRVLPTPLLYLSAFFEASRPEYYRRLRAVSEGGEWAEWVEYFLHGVARIAQNALDRSSRIRQLLQEWRGVLKASSPKVDLRVLERLSENPFVTIPGVAEELGIAFTTAQRALERLERLGIVRAASEARRGRVYCAWKLLEILEEPVRLDFSY